MNGQDYAVDNLIEIINDQNFFDEEIEFIDLSQLRFELERIQAHPININSKEIEIFLRLGILSLNQFNAIQNYISSYGKIIALEELLQIQELDKELIKNLKPFIQFEKIIELKDFSKGRIFKESKNDFTIHYQRILQASSAFQGSTPKYIGDPSRIMIKFSSKLYKRWRFGLNLEKDSGENFAWNLPSSKVGFDHTSAYLFYSGTGFIKNIVLGDFQIGFGQALTFWRRLSFGKSSNAVSIRKVAKPIRPHTGIDEFNFLRGIALHLKKNNMSAISFLSYRKLDAHLKDSTANTYNSLISSGYHRSLGEISNAGKITELIFGGHFMFQTNKFKSGITYAHQMLSGLIVPESELYAINYFSGNENFTLGINLDYLFNNGHVFSELSTSKNMGKALLIGSVLTLDPNFSISLLHRFYSKKYQPISSSAFGESGKNQNESGIYLGIELKFSRKSMLNAYYDLYSFPWIKNRVPSLSEGEEVLFKFSHKTSKSLVTIIRYRFKKSKIKIPGSKDFSIQYRQQIRLENKHNINSLIELRYRLELHYLKALESKAGYLFYIDIILQSPEKPYSISMRYALFDTDDYNTRIYAYERDVYYAYSIRPYFYKGQKVYLNLKWRARRFFTFVFRISNTRYPFDSTIGSGINLIESSTKTEFTFQLRMRW